MRRFLLPASVLVLVLLLASCGNKGPLVRAPAHHATASPAPAATAPASTATMPAPAMTAPAPATSTAADRQP